MHPRRLLLRGLVLCALLPLRALPAQPASLNLATACQYLEHSIAASPAGPVLLPSYPGSEEPALQNAAFVYDNAAAAIAFVACGDPGAARRIGDALLLALDHDRYWHDGRLRNAYAAGAIGPQPLKLAGWWDRHAGRWLEDGYQAGSDSGNSAWAMLALLTLDRVTQDPRYRTGALRLAQWVDGTQDRRGAGGFRGGSFGHEPAPDVLQWKSTEHNTDLAAAFSWLAQLTGDAHWRAQAMVAQRFVSAMWRGDCGCFAAGTALDGVTVNPVIALDAQIWPLLALSGERATHGVALATASRELRFEDGYTYSHQGTGFWTEGSAQVALLLALEHRDADANALLQAVNRHRGPDAGYYAGSPGGTSTGFMLATDPKTQRMYFHLEHLGAAAWAALAEQRYNPFRGSHDLPP